MINLKTLFRKHPKNLFPESKHITKYAFTSGGVDYYQYDDLFNLPYDRGLKALVYFQEVRLNCDRAFLEAHVAAIRNALTITAKHPSLDFNTIHVLNEQLGQRLSLPPDTELLYKLASVVFFDKNEKPETYEFAYGAKKIALWKKNTSVLDFFLQKPIQELLPFLKDVGENLQTYHTMMQEVNQYHLATLSANLSDKQRTQLNTRSVLSPVATPQS